MTDDLRHRVTDALRRSATDARRCCVTTAVALTLVAGGAGPASAQPDLGGLTAAPMPGAGDGSAPARDVTEDESIGRARSSSRSVWRDLFGGIGRDVTRLPSLRTAELLTIGSIAAAGVRPADSHVSRSISGVTKLHEPLEPGAVLGSTPFQMAGSLATYGLARWTGNVHLATVGADLFRAQLVAEGLTVGLKQSFRRNRPEGGGFAFPSGHTTVSFASATVLQRHYGWRLGLPAYGIAGYVALSRVQMKRHYLSDVAFGAALGIAAGRTVTLGSARRIELAPLMTSGGGGVQMTWRGR